MTLTFSSIMASAGIDPGGALVIRHVYDAKHADDTAPIYAHSTYGEVLTYTGVQDLSRFPATPPRVWVVFLPDGSGRARLWRVVVNHGEIGRGETNRTFDLEVIDDLADLRDRLVIGWPAPRAWQVKATKAAQYPVLEIADAQSEPFPGFDALILSHAELQAVVREHRYAAWRTALASVAGIYLITDTRDGRNYVGKADGAERILQRWTAYATNGHGGNVELRKVDPVTFRFSLLRVFDPATPESVINSAERHFMVSFDSRRHGLNG